MGELTPAIQSKLVDFDSAPLLFYLEEHSRYGATSIRKPVTGP